MTEAAYVYDAMRTPRSRGKADGTLNEVKPIEPGHDASGRDAGPGTIWTRPASTT